MNIAALMASFATGTYTVTRRTRSTAVTRGVVDDGVETSLTVRGSVSPGLGADLLKVPEGRRTNETQVIFTDTRLYVGEPTEGYEADRLLIRGVLYELVHLETWTDSRSTGLGYKAIAVRM